MSQGTGSSRGATPLAFARRRTGRRDADAGRAVGSRGVSEERDDNVLKDEAEPTAEQTPDEPDAAKLSDEAAAEAARAFLGTAEPEEEVSVDEAKNVLRRAGAVAEVEPEVSAEQRAAVAEPQAAPSVAPTKVETDTGQRWYVRSE